MSLKWLLLALLATGARAAPFAQLAAGGALFQGVIGERRMHGLWGARGGADLNGWLGAEGGILLGSETGGPLRVRVETSWRLCEARLSLRRELGGGFEAGAAAGLLFDLGSSALVVEDQGAPAESARIRAVPGASGGALLRWRRAPIELRVDLGAWLRGGRTEMWGTLAGGVVL